MQAQLGEKMRAYLCSSPPIAKLENASQPTVHELLHVKDFFLLIFAGKKYAKNCNRKKTTRRREEKERMTRESFLHNNKYKFRHQHNYWPRLRNMVYRFCVRDSDLFGPCAHKQICLNENSKWQRLATNHHNK